MFYDEILDGVSVHMSLKLYEEIMECEVNATDTENLVASQQQFYQSMITASVDSTDASLITTEDGLVYFLNVILPTNMEMWSTWGTPTGARFIRESRDILQEFDAYCPY